MYNGAWQLTHYAWTEKIVADGDTTDFDTSFSVTPDNHLADIYLFDSTEAVLYTKRYDGGNTYYAYGPYPYRISGDNIIGDEHWVGDDNEYQERYEYSHTVALNNNTLRMYFVEYEALLGSGGYRRDRVYTISYKRYTDSLPKVDSITPICFHLLKTNRRD